MLPGKPEGRRGRCPEYRGCETGRRFEPGGQAVTGRLHVAIRTEWNLSRSAATAGELDTAFSHLERAHILSQRLTGMHVRTHLLMLGIGWRRRNVREVLGQLSRTVAASVTPAVSVTGSRGADDGVQYGLLWWLYSDREGERPYAWAGSGFGGQRPIVFPEYDLVAVFTGWNVLPDRPSLGRKTALEQVLAAVRDRHSSAASQTPP